MKKRKRRIKKKKVQSGTSGTSVKVANDIQTLDTLRLPKNTSGYRYIRKRISEVPGRWVYNRNPLYPKERSRTGTTRAEKTRKWKLLIFAPPLKNAMTSYCFCVECLGIQVEGV